MRLPRTASLIGLLALGAGSLGPRSARASMVMALELPDLTARAEHILVGDVMSVVSAWDKDHKRIFTTIEVRVGESWKGDAAPGGTVKIVQPGGQIGDLEMRVLGVPAWTAGESAVLFLQGRDRHTLVGLGQGKRPLRRDAALGKWMVESGDRSAAVRVDPRGQLAPVAPDARLSLDELRARIRGLLGPAR